MGKNEIFVELAYVRILVTLCDQILEVVQALQDLGFSEGEAVRYLLMAGAKLVKPQLDVIAETRRKGVGCPGES